MPKSKPNQEQKNNCCYLHEHEDLDFVKAKTKEAALSSCRSYNKNVPPNMSKEEFTALQNLSKSKDLIIQKSDKGKIRQDYLEKMNDI